jgi:NarL family two-component system response regulator LiaR
MAAEAYMAASEELGSGDGSRGRVLAVDDHAVFRALIRELVDATRGLEAVGEADSGERAVEAALELEPDLVLMDVVMPGLGGIAATRRIKAIRPSTIVVLVSTTHPDELPLDAATCLADEFVWKSDLRPSLLDEIWQRHRGGRTRGSSPAVA